MAPLMFQREAGGMLQIGTDAHHTLLSFCQHGIDETEAGGVLLGRHLIDGTNLVVDQVTSPQPSDRRSRFGFFRSIAHHYLARRRWEATNQTSAYIGLWHSHPEPDPAPSHTDTDDWRKALAKDVFPGDNLYFLIVGQSRIRLWEGYRGGLIRECNAIESRQKLK